MSGPRGGVFIGIGANLGDPYTQVRAALDGLDALPQTSVQCTSTIYRTPSWGDPTQPDYANAAAELRTGLDPTTLMHALLGLELRLGRNRQGEARWAARLIDLDLLVFREQRVAEDGIEVPHPRLAERAFVLVPLHEIAPQLAIPGLGKVADLLKRVDATRVKRWRPRVATTELATLPLGTLPKREQ